MAKYRYTAGFWLSLAAAAWCLFGLGAGFNAIANNPDKYVNDVMITTLVLFVVIAALFIRLALRFQRNGRNFAKPS